MPFDVHDFAGAPAEDQAAGRHNRKVVAGWLFAICGMMLVMFVLGAATRLTGSGLSIMEWAPLRGVLPPWSDAEWQRLFALYQTIPQFQLRNVGMDLAGFKGIFWLEWMHRLWGRLLGAAFAVPLLWFWLRGRIERRLRWRLALILALGGAQGGVGWFMVASGFLPDSTAVAPIRLVVHLGLAVLLYAAVLWTALAVLRPYPPPGVAAWRGVRWLCGGGTGLLVLTILAGGFVAGTGAGRAYNTYPLMDGRIVPEGYASLAPMWRNLIENVAAVQFHHRLFATMTLLVTLAALLAGCWRAPAHPARVLLYVLAGVVLAQYALGVATLLLVVPIDLAVAHQLLAVLALSAAMAALHALRPARPTSAGAT